MVAEQHSASNALSAAGIACPKCSATTFKTVWQKFRDGTRHVRADCGECKAFIRYLPQTEVKVERPAIPADRAAQTHPARKPPPATTEWLGWVRGADQLWRPVALAPTLGRLWDVLLHFPGAEHLDKLAVPAAPASGRASS